MFRGPEGRQRGLGQLGVWEHCDLSFSGVWGEIDEIEFGAFLALKSDIRWQQFG